MRDGGAAEARGVMKAGGEGRGRRKGWNTITTSREAVINIEYVCTGAVTSTYDHTSFVQLQPLLKTVSSFSCQWHRRRTCAEHYRGNKLPRQSLVSSPNSTPGNLLIDTNSNQFPWQVIPCPWVYFHPQAGVTFYSCRPFYLPLHRAIKVRMVHYRELLNTKQPSRSGKSVEAGGDGGHSRPLEYKIMLTHVILYVAIWVSFNGITSF